MLLKYSLIAILCLPISTIRAADSPRQAATFRQEPARVGDRVAQHVNASLDLQTAILQADQLANQSSSALRRQQQRFIEVTEVAEGQVRRAHVKFPISRLTSPENEDPQQEIVQSVEGKSYNVTRQGDRLLVTDAAGSIPPLDEFEIVVNSLQTLGLPSPLAKFLLGRTVHLGERLPAPPQIAAQMMGFDNPLGEIQKFEFQLQELRTIDEQPCAVFAARIEATGDHVNPIQVNVAGQVIIQIETCRTVAAELGGPLSMTATERTDQGSFQYSAEGEMHVAIRSQYGHAKK
ncbi:MAG: hypothetical protein MI725_07740 [Pirellulales bacterium]|nr:hypothetical protein [Pirellulales bacterium]